MSDYRISDGKEILYRYTAYEYDSMNRLTAVSECKTDENSNMTSFNYIGAEDNILLKARPAENGQADFYTPGLKITHNKEYR